MNAKILSNIKADVTAGDYTEPMGIRQTVHFAPVRGFIAQISIGATGVVFRRGKTLVLLPTAEIMKMVAQAEPYLDHKNPASIAAAPVMPKRKSVRAATAPAALPAPKK